MRHQVENLFATLKDWRPVATCYDRWAHIFLSALLLPRHSLLLLITPGPKPSQHTTHHTFLLTPARS